MAAGILSIFLIVNLNGKIHGNIDLFCKMKCAENARISFFMNTDFIKYKDIDTITRIFANLEPSQIRVIFYDLEPTKTFDPNGMRYNFFLDKQNIFWNFPRFSMPFLELSVYQSRGEITEDFCITSNAQLSADWSQNSITICDNEFN